MIIFSLPLYPVVILQLTEQLIREIVNARQKGISFSSQERTSLKKLTELLEKVLS